MPRLSALAAVILVLSIFGVVNAQTAFPLEAKRILFLGDSITNAGHYVADIEVQLLVQNTAVPKMINIGLPSETCTGLSEPDHPFPRPDVHERLQRALQKVRPDVVVACYGMNDGIYHPFDEQRFADYQKGIRRLIDQVHAANAKIVLLTPPPFDPVPLRTQPGKLLPSGAEKYAWFAIYENYNDVIQRYAEWIMTLDGTADLVIDVFSPLTEFLKEQRKQDPGFYVAGDGVHMNAVGHRVMAKAILNAWGLNEWTEPETMLAELVSRKERLLHASWLSEVGHLRPGVKPGLLLAEAEQQAEQLSQQIQRLVKR